MRGFLIFLVLVIGIFFGVGEWQGWYAGVPSQTPVLVYKKDRLASATRRVVSEESLDFNLEGKLRQGTLTVKGYHQQVASFQSGSRSGPERLLFEETFTEGQTLKVSETLSAGKGAYRLDLIFEDATGMVTLKLPKSTDL